MNTEENKRIRKSKATNPAASLIAALKFVAVAQKKAQSSQQQFCVISGNRVTASNGVLTISSKFEEDLEACPHTSMFIKALSKVKENMSITQHSPTAIVVKSGAFSAVVPCVEFGDLVMPAPDERCALIDDRIKEAFKVLAPLATEGYTPEYLASVLLQSGSAIATNGFVLAEYWHSFDLPPNMLIPKAAALAIAKAKKPLTGFGYSGSSATFWFEDDSFIKTQLFSERYPGFQSLLNCGGGASPRQVPEEFYKAVHSLKSFFRIVYFEDDGIASHEEDGSEFTYKIEGLPSGMAFEAKYLLTVESSFKNVHFDKDSNKAYFFGENVRGVVSGFERPKPETECLEESTSDQSF